jgi:hypothetical protein
MHQLIQQSQLVPSAPGAADLLSPVSRFRTSRRETSPLSAPTQGHWTSRSFPVPGTVSATPPASGAVRTPPDRPAQ